MKKVLTVALSLLFVFAAVACSGNNKPVTDNTAADKAGMTEYYNSYTGLYDTNLNELLGYNMYTDVNTVNDYYKDKDYPGNEKYLNEVKSAYKDSRDKIQTFVNGLKNDVKAEDKELKKMNDEMISEGEKLIKDIDAKLAKLDTITDADLTKSKDDFINFVDNTAKSVKTDVNTFGDMLRNMDKKLGIERSNMTK